MAIFNYTNFTNDTLTGSGTADTITLNGTGNAVYVDGLAGNDIVVATTASQFGYLGATISGGEGNDTISGFSNDSLLLGGAGADIINLDARSDDITVYGGQGSDTIRGTAGEEALIFGNMGDDSIRLRGGGNLSDSTVFGGQGNDTIAGSEEGSDYLSGDLGNDLINSDDDSDSSTLVGGLGDDTLNSDGSGDLLFGNLGNDTFRLRNTDSTVFGGQGVDQVTMTAAAEGSVVFGDLGNDVLTAGATEGVALDGGEGNDLLAASASSAVLTGGDEDDLDIFDVTGFSGSDDGALTITDFVSGVDVIRTGFGSAFPGTNYSEATTDQEGYASALVAAQNGGAIAAGSYVFVAAADAGYLFYQDGATTRGLVLEDATSLDSFAARDIA
ncbi:calcium-binding protein [Methylobacterium sp. A54F]